MTAGHRNELDGYLLLPASDGVVAPARNESSPMRSVELFVSPQTES